MKFFHPIKYDTFIILQLQLCGSLSDFEDD